MPFVPAQNALPHAPFPGVEGRVVHGTQMTLAFWDLPAGAEVPEHAHVHEQILHVVHGLVEVTLGTESQRVVADGSVVIPSEVPHGVRVVEDARVIDVFHPARPEYGRRG